MRLAILSDIHSNLPALEAVLDDDRRRRASTRSGAWATSSATGPSPTSAPRWSRERCDVCLVGNHDLAVLGRARHLVLLARPRPRPCAGPSEAMSRRDDASSCAASSRPPSRRRGGDLPRVAARPGLGVRAVARPGRRVHPRPGDAGELRRALARRPVLRPRRAGRPRRAARTPGARRPEPAPASRSVEGRWLINPGSVGQPRDGDPRAAWLELDTDAWHATYHRVDYEIDRAADAIVAADLPEHLARRLYVGQ